MSIFSAIMGKIFHPADAAQPAPPASAAAPSAPQPSSAQATTVPAAAATQASPRDVDVEAVLTRMASQKAGLTHVISLVSVQGVVSGERVRRRAKRMHLRLANWDSNLLKGQVLVPRLSAALR